MSNTKTRTIEQIVLGLALLEKDTCGYPKPCLCVDSDCPCHSLGFIEVHGKVPKYPMLRRPCPGPPGTRVGCNSGWFQGHPCIGCGGTPTFKDSTPERAGTPVPMAEWKGGLGWLPVTTTDALLEAGKRFNVGIHWVGDAWRASGFGVGVHGESSDKQIAIALAIEAAEGLSD